MLVQNGSWVKYCKLPVQFEQAGNFNHTMGLMAQKTAAKAKIRPDLTNNRGILIAKIQLILFGN